MITAVDTSVLLDVFADGEYRDRSLAALRRCVAEGTLVACDVVWAETGAAFPSGDAADAVLRGIPVDYVPIDRAAASRAADAWRAYRRAGGARERLIADFLIGAHALVQADRLLTRDRGFHRAAFDGLAILDPSRP